MAISGYSVLDAAMRSAYVALARRLERTADLDLHGLAADLEMLAAAQPDPLWRDQHTSLASALRAVAQPSADEC